MPSINWLALSVQWHFWFQTRSKVLSTICVAVITKSPACHENKTCPAFGRSSVNLKLVAIAFFTANLFENLWDMNFWLNFSIPRIQIWMTLFIPCCLIKKRSQPSTSPNLLGTLDQQLLRKGHTIQAQLDTQITTCHHKRLGFGDNALDVGESLRVRHKWRSNSGIGRVFKWTWNLSIFTYMSCTTQRWPWLNSSF